MKYLLFQINFIVASSFGTRDVRVGINVTDVNDPPTCVQSKVIVNATVKYKAGEELTRLTCSDADVLPSYKVLSYRLVGTAADIGKYCLKISLVQYFIENKNDIILRFLKRKSCLKSNWFKNYSFAFKHLFFV